MSRLPSAESGHIVPPRWWEVQRAAKLTLGRATCEAGVLPMWTALEQRKRCCLRELWLKSPAVFVLSDCWRIIAWRRHPPVLLCAVWVGLFPLNRGQPG